MWLSAFAVLGDWDGSQAASSGTDGNIDWAIDGDTLTLSKNPDAAEGTMKDYNQFIGNCPGWEGAEGWSGVTKVVVCDGVTSIGKLAFYDCKTLVSVTVGQDVAEIRPLAFLQCTRIFEIINLSELAITQGSDDHG